MSYNPDIHHRRSIRLRGYDYSMLGAYFLTICIQERECLLGDIVDGEMRLNDAGRMVCEWWLKLPDKFSGVAVDQYICMPNHFHGIIVLVGADPCVCPGLPDPCVCPGLPDPCVCPGSPDQNLKGGHAGPPLHLNCGDVGGHAGPPLHKTVQWFKTMTTNAYIHGVTEYAWPQFPGRLWQRNYYERVIRNDAELSETREYILSNPANWANDDNYS